MLGLVIHQVDIVGAYLESLLDDNEFPIYMKLPPGMHQFRQVREGLLCRLLKSLYGLRQSRQLWNQNRLKKKIQGSDNSCQRIRR